MSAPKWTPPINGWQYRLRENGPRFSRELRAVTTEFVLWQNLGVTRSPWFLSYILPDGNSIGAAGTIEHCCRVLSAALRGVK